MLTGIKIPSWLKRREWLLAILVVVTFFFFNSQQPDNYTFPKLLNQSRVYIVDVGFMSMGMLLILILGDIDISVASIAALSATVMSVSYGGGKGLPFCLSLLLMVVVGALCGFINGLLVTRFKELFPMIITLATSTLFRGVAYIILKDQSAGGFPTWFSRGLGYGSVSMLGLDVPIMLLCLLAVIPFFHVWLHHTVSGRELFAVGTNLTASRYSGLKTDQIKLIAFLMNGVFAALGGFFLASRTGSVKYTIGTGFEMQAIAVAVLGGASTSGGKGSVPGLLLALVLLTALKNGLMLLYNDAFVLNLAVGLLLILVVLIPNITSMIGAMQMVRRQRLSLEKN